MYLRILVVTAVFNQPLALTLTIPLIGLFMTGIAVSAVQYRFSAPVLAKPLTSVRNPLELGTATVFAVLFIATSLLSSWVTAQFGAQAVYVLAALIGFTDIDPFVLNLAQGGTANLSMASVATAILIATSSNNLLKAGYAAAFAGPRAVMPSLIALLALAAVAAALSFFLQAI